MKNFVFMIVSIGLYGIAPREGAFSWVCYLAAGMVCAAIAYFVISAIKSDVKSVEVEKERKIVYKKKIVCKRKVAKTRQLQQLA